MSFRALALLGCVAASAGGVAAQERQPATPPVTVPDLIGLTLFGSDAHNGSVMPDAHVRSPDGKRIAVVVQRGDLVRNTVDYTLLIFGLADPRRPSGPDTLVRMSARSNEPAISRVQWLADNAHVVFLGRRDDAVAQVYSVDVTTHALAARTHSPTGITNFLMAPAGDPFFYQEQGTIDTSDYATVRAHGFAIPRGVYVFDVIAGDLLGKVRARAPHGYRFAAASSDTALALPDSSAGLKECGLVPEYGPPFSPRGDAVMLACRPRTIPVTWKGYRNAHYRMFADQYGEWGQELVLYDLATRSTTVVLNAPLMPQAETNFAWAPDGRSIVMSGALLPLAGPDSAHRATQRAVVEIDLASGALTVVVPRDSLVVQRWDARSGLVEFARAFRWFDVNDGVPRAYWRKTPRGWAPAAPQGSNIPPSFAIAQGPNEPPRLTLVDPRTRTARTVLDPNPGLTASRRFGRVEVFHWTTKAGNVWAGGLYYPPDYVPGRRYPLVLQTHGYDSTLFSPDGVFTTGVAAQPLAGAGIVVLQTGIQIVGDPAAAEDSPAEGPADQDMVEGAIDALDRRGLVDRSRVGLEGFSRTCFSALYFLTHSSYPIAASDLTDGVDFSYLQYLVYPLAPEWERVNGGRPWGSSQAQVIDRAPGFRLDRVHTPLRLTALGFPSLLGEWEPYAGLSLQGKPTELVYIPDGAHILAKPWERLTSQQGAVDWYRFWLQGYEDPDSTKAGQYARWRKLRAQRDSGLTTTTR